MRETLMLAKLEGSKHEGSLVLKDHLEHLEIE